MSISANAIDKKERMNERMNQTVGSIDVVNGGDQMNPFRRGEDTESYLGLCSTKSNSIDVVDNEKHSFPLLFVDSFDCQTIRRSVRTKEIVAEY